MIHCPNLTNDNRCQVAGHLADCSVQFISGCRCLQRVFESASGQSSDDRYGHR